MSDPVRQPAEASSAFHLLGVKVNTFSIENQPPQAPFISEIKRKQNPTGLTWATEPVCTGPCCPGPAAVPLTLIPSFFCCWRSSGCCTCSPGCLFHASPFSSPAGPFSSSHLSRNVTSSERPRLMSSSSHLSLFLFISFPAFSPYSFPHCPPH